MRKPTILISSDFIPDRAYFLKQDLIERLWALGARTKILLYDINEIESELDQADGLLIPGSQYDLRPETYGQKKLYDSVVINPVRENFEFQLLERALKRDLPILGICWGFQLMNVFQGGSLYQHLPAEFPSDIEHEQKTPSTQPAHDVFFEAQGQGRIVFGTPKLAVNSTHHQGVKNLGRDLIAEARSSDGLVECFRMSEKKFVWGVEWHPERLAEDPVIQSFLEACQHSD